MDVVEGAMMAVGTGLGVVVAWEGSAVLFG